MKRVLGILTVGLLAGLTLTAAQRAETSRQVEWQYYGGDQGGMKYSSLADITPQNVQNLQLAWQWKHWETPFPEYKTTPGFFESTPLMTNVGARSLPLRKFIQLEKVYSLCTVVRDVL